MSSNQQAHSRDRAYSSLAVLIPVFLLMFPAAAQTFVFTNASIHSADWVLDDTDGGIDVLTAEVLNTASDNPETGVSRDYGAWAFASAETGRLAFTMSSSIDIAADGPSSRLPMGLATINNRVQDSIAIGAGGTGLSDGDPARIRLQIPLDGIVQIGGRPSGGTSAAFQVWVGEGPANNLIVDYNTGSLSPPQDFEVHELWDVIVDVTVGGVLNYDMSMSGWMNGTAYDAGQSGTNFLSFDPIFRVSHAPGFELLELTSEAGAPTSAIPVATQFNDVPPDHWAFSFIETLADSSITAGCGNENYCPQATVTRAQMAVFLERGIHGSDYSPPAAIGNVFLDVSVGSFAASFIEQFFLEGITAGCGNNSYCPTAPVTRAQMAVFLLRAKHGPDYSPPQASGVFGDVDLSHWAVHWIEQLAAEGITSGCGNENYCPNAVVTRDQMAVFLVRTFDL